MSKTVVGWFGRAEDAQQTVQALISSGIPSGNITSKATELQHPEEYGVEGASPATQLPAVFAVIGTVLGALVGLVAGTGHLNTATIGLVPPGGSMLSGIAWTLAGAGIGVIVGVVLGLLIGFVLRAVNVLVPRASQRVTQVTVKATDHQVPQASAIMLQYHVIEIEGAAAGH
ncbi:MAG: hypothetical protein HC828_06085 [Blastochloris sp.]|nr:hypothetical protein [Blastochloris sp.]